MPEGELTAFIPVVREIAVSRNPKGSWQMPAFHLYRRLLEVCEGRVARSDLGWASPPEEDDSVEENLNSLATENECRKWAAKQKEAEKVGQVSVRPKYIDYLLDWTPVLQSKVWLPISTGHHPCNDAGARRFGRID